MEITGGIDVHQLQGNTDPIGSCTFYLFRMGVVIPYGWLLFRIDCNLRIDVLVVTAQLTLQKSCVRGRMRPKNQASLLLYV